MNGRDCKAGENDGFAPDDADRETLRQRELAYRLFSNLFGTEVTIDFLREASQARPALNGVLGEYLSSLGDDHGSLERARDEAVADFSRLFLNMSASPVCLYESPYTSSEGLLMQDARDEVRACYRECGFSLMRGKRLPEDHLSFELEFMAELCARELSCKQADDGEGAGRSRAAQELFLSNHLLRWVFDVCDGVGRTARTGLYRGVAEALRTFMEAERDYCLSKPSAPKSPS